MRNDVKLGFAIGGVLLAVLIVYVLVVPGGTSQPKKVGQATQPAQTVASNTAASNRHSATGGDAAKVTLEPVTPAVPSAAATTPLPAVPPPSYTPPSTPPVAAAKTDPFAPKTETPAATDSLAKASTSKNDDWNAILNQPPMLMTETPVASHTSAPAASASASPAAAPTTPSTPSSDTTFSALTQNSTPPISAEPPSSATSQPSAAASSAGSRTHRIAQGETFASISTAAYGSSKYYPQIIKANPGVDPNHLKVGATITLPDIATPGVRPTTPTATAAPAAAAEAQHASARVAATPIDSTKEYRVQQGDSLYKISLKLYGKSDRANKIFELNKQSMGDDPHHLKVGQVLQLPEPPTQTTTASR